MDTTERRPATDAETACFEAGIKFGSLYHQFAGTPVSPKSADSLARAIEESIENQPHCESVGVEIIPERLEEAIARVPSDDGESPSDSKRHGASNLAEGEEAIDVGYTELTGRLMEVEVVVEYEGIEVRTRMEMRAGYPEMRIESVRD